jgi:uncharacterized DUF497 family protein
MQHEQFEWDDWKAEAISANPGVSFNARLVFADAFSFERLDDKTDYGEDRTVVTGMEQGRLLTGCLH